MGFSNVVPAFVPNWVGWCRLRIGFVRFAWDRCGEESLPHLFLDL